MPDSAMTGSSSRSSCKEEVMTAKENEKWAAEIIRRTHDDAESAYKAILNSFPPPTRHSQGAKNLAEHAVRLWEVGEKQRKERGEG